MTERSLLFYWMLPSFAAMCFMFYPVLIIMYPDAMLKDPGVGWHLISGHYMLDNKALLSHDIFSFTRPGQEWVTYEWLFQCIAAGLEKIGGLPLLSVVSALIYGSLPILIYKRMIKEGTNIYIALVLLFVMFVGLFGHSHARPHIFTYLFFTLLLERVFSYEQERISARSLFLFVPVMILWTNLHGGFFAGIAIAGIAFLVYLVRFFCTREVVCRERMMVYFFFGFWMVMASLVNPYGWNLHLSILHYLGLESLHKMAEYVSPNFNNGFSSETVFELLLLTLFLIVSSKKNKVSAFELALLFFFIYQSLHAVRHIFLFCLLVVPVLGRELTLIIERHDNWFTKRSRRLATEQLNLKSDRIWIPVICCVFVVLSLTATDLFKKDLYGKHLTAGAAAFIENNMELLANPFNTENIGGALIYSFWPEMKVFGDDRSDFYGDDFYIDDYIEVLHVKPKWETVLEKYKVSSAIVANEKLATVMKASPNWRVAYQDKKNTIFLNQSK